MRFAMSQISGRRTDQLGDFVAVLELRAVDLDDRARVLEQYFGGSLDDTGFARTRGAQEQKVPDRTSGRVHSRQMHLVDVDDLLDRLILPYDHPMESRLQLCRVPPGLPGVQWDIEPYHLVHRLSPRGSCLP